MPDSDFLQSKKTDHNSWKLAPILSPLTKKYFGIVLAVAVVISFSFYLKITLFTTGQWQLHAIKYTDAARSQGWEQALQDSGDEFIKKLLAGDPLTHGLEPYSYSFFPAYLAYKYLGLKGESLWLTQKILTSLLGVAVILSIFGIGYLLFDVRIGMIASLLCAISPHIWITYSFDGTLRRSYSIFFNLLVVLLFLLYQQRRKKRYFIGTILALSFGFLFFHIGSFAIPGIILIYCVVLAWKEKRGLLLLQFISILFLSAGLAFIGDKLYSSYFGLDRSVWVNWFAGYLEQVGASHSVKGLIFFSLEQAFDNIGYFMASVFIDGKDTDWHYGIAPPEIPLIYSYFITFFSLPALYKLWGKRRQLTNGTIFLLVWLAFYIFAYSLVVTIRIKNIVPFIPAFCILGAYGTNAAGNYATKLLNLLKYNIKSCQPVMTSILLVGSVMVGCYFLFFQLPSKNFYNGGAYMGTHQIFKYFKERGFSEKTTIAFTQDAAYPIPNMMLRFLTEDVPKFKSLASFGVVSHPPGEKEAKKIAHMENTLLPTSDKIFYCFHYWDNLMGQTYVTDEYFRKSFVLNHQDITPFIINGLNGEPLWRIYEVPG